MIRFEAMDEPTFSAWRDASIEDYAHEKVDAGHWLAIESHERAGYVETDVTMLKVVAG